MRFFTDASGRYSVLQTRNCLQIYVHQWVDSWYPAHMLSFYYYIVLCTLATTEL